MGHPRGLYMWSLTSYPMSLITAADAIAALNAAGHRAMKSPARSRVGCQTLCYLVNGQYVNLGRLRQLAREVLSPKAAAAEPAPTGGRPVLTLNPGPCDGPYLAGDGITLWSFETEAQARAAAGEIAASGAEPYLAGPGPLGRPVALRPTVAAITAAIAAAPKPVRLNATSEPPAAEPVVSAAPTGASLSGLPWDPGTPAARERVALQGDRVVILWPIAQALRGAGVALPPSWATDGPVMAGELSLNAALALLPLGAIAQAATALAALPPVTTAQDLALTLCDTGAVPGRPHL